MEDKVTKFGNCAHNLVPNVENILLDAEKSEYNPIEVLATCASGSLNTLENIVKAGQDDGDKAVEMLIDLVKSGMAGAALLLGLKDEVSKLANQMTDLYARKNRDYGNSFDKSMNKFGLVVAAIRIGDKVNRLQSLIEKGGAEVKDESIADTFIDLACYSIMTLMWMEGQIEK
jgi:hypothetical protein